MRLNRGTLVLLIASVVVIVAVLLLNNQPANAPAPTPEATAEGAGPIFAAIADKADTVVRFEAVNNDTSEKTVLTKDEGGAWTVAEATNTSTLATDQTKAAEVVNKLAALASTDRFPLEERKLEDFGLDTPTYTFTLTGAENATYTVKVGNKSKTSARYYALVNDDAATIYVLPQDQVDSLVQQMIALPPYVASPTPTVTPTATLNPFSEQELATQTAQAEATIITMMTATAQATVEATPEATGEATSEPLSTPAVTPSTSP